MQSETPDYRKVIREVPDLAAQIAGRVGAARAMVVDDLPAAPGIGDPMSPVDRAVDDLEKLRETIVAAVELWCERLGVTTPANPFMFGVGVRVCTTDPVHAGAMFRPLAEWLDGRWGEMGEHPGFADWLATLDVFLVPAWRRLDANPRKQRPRECVNCSARDVWADMEHGSALCASCGEVMRAEVWLTVSRAAKHLDVSDRTVRNWIESGNVRVRGDGKKREVELRSCIQERDVREVKKKLSYFGGISD